MEFSLPLPVLSIVQTITSQGFTCELVGGAVRDLMLGIPTKDWDFATNAKPEEILPLFQESFCENVFGTVMVAHKHLCAQFGLEAGTEDPNLIYDITTYRSDGTYENYRHPTSVTWGKTIEEDLKRRDFTINAMALLIQGTENWVQEKNSTLITVPCTLTDPFNGQQDLEARVIRTVGNPDERLSEDALRILRAIRFSVQLSCTLTAEVTTSILSHTDLLSHISQERISEEFMKMLSTETPDVAIVLLDKLNVLQYIIPELLETKGVKQAGHHIYDVWEHSVRALGACTSPDPVVRLATLLHDIAKPQTAKQGPNGTVTFYNHEVVGARIAKAIAQRLRLSKKDCDRIFTLVRWHMFVYDKEVTDAYIRRFIRRVGVDQINDMMALRTGDRVGSGSKANSWRLDELRERIYNELHQPLQLKDMAIDGNDVMKELNIKPGPEIGKILNELFEDVLDHPEHNEREYLLQQLKRYV
ncbi:hypothetical protein C5B42_00460 [Candidatus Cerribacteria bacterium 'Amazon FNV 2010 28 9']|uniref:HD domain-containing protein n=1 Tax=Candidatus Cerribacteria bacterium 'Amazon FNV 2010 28 9' TaxID=2081795 RepID=A0A317JU89_9BACT|nr:MAG: hypothetical protein C5B42_00460 [Candidatus Cerribacteria bacterium 'Amazon FNV 2010 28 9']